MTGPNADQRSTRRSSIYLVAALRAGDSNERITIRDISAGGVRIVISSSLAPGSPVRVERGTLSQDGRIAWRAGALAGVEFDAPIAVDEWLLEGCHGQRRVDRVLARTRELGQPEPLAAPIPDAATLRTRLIEEIGFAERLFEAVAEGLSNDSHVVAAFGKQLQTLELGCKILQTAAMLLRSPQPGDHLEAVGLHEMKARLLRK